MSTFRAFVRKASFILREEGALVFADRLARAGIVRLRRVFRDSSANLERWRALKDRFRGERVFVLGNGPSLNRTPLHLLAGERTMCFNRFNLMFERLSWRPTFYSVIDDRVLHDMAGEMEAVLREVEYAFFPDLHPYNIDFTKLLPASPNTYWLHLDRLTFSDDLPWCGINKTVANVGLQVLAYLGFAEIYLVGVDMSYQQQASVSHNTPRDVTAAADDDPNHFDPRYFGAGRKYHQPRMDETLEKFAEAKSFFDERGVKVMNAGVGGSLEVFPRVEFQSLFDLSPLEELRRLLAPTGRAPRSETLRDAVPEAVALRPGTPWPSGAVAVICTASDGASRIPKVIFDYVPYGPFGDEYLFLRRSA